MATSMVPKTTCDVYPEAPVRTIKRWRIVLVEVPADFVEPDDDGRSWVKDLSYKARARLEHFIEVGLAPPRPKKKPSETNTGSET